MVFPPENQSLVLCALVAGAGGAFEVLATAIVAYSDSKLNKNDKSNTPNSNNLLQVTTNDDEEENENEKEWSKEFYMKLALVGNILLQICASVLGNTVSTWFGPVSIAGPIFFASQLITNMIVFGYFLGLESFTKSMKCGTYEIVVGTVLLCINGPQIQNDQNPDELLSRWYSILWSSILLFGMTISSIYLFHGISKYKESNRIIILLIARGCALSVNLTVSKPFALKPGYPMILLWLFFKILSGAVYTFAIVVQSTSVIQGRFVPLNTMCTLALNAITGIVVWEDWKVVDSWLGYIFSFTLLVLGSYLLLGEEGNDSNGVEEERDGMMMLFTPDNPEYGHRDRLRRLSANYLLKMDFEDTTVSTMSPTLRLNNTDSSFDAEKGCNDDGASGSFSPDCDEFVNQVCRRGMKNAMTTRSSSKIIPQDSVQQPHLQSELEMDDDTSFLSSQKGSNEEISTEKEDGSVEITITTSKSDESSSQYENDVSEKEYPSSIQKALATKATRSSLKKGENNKTEKNSSSNNNQCSKK